MPGYRHIVTAFAKLSSALCLTGLLVSESARAQVQDAPQPESAVAVNTEYNRTIDEAVTEFQAREFVRARALFEQAFRLFPSARAARGVAMVAYEQRDDAAAFEWFERALHAQEQPLSEALRDDVELALKRLRALVGRIQLALKPEQAELRLDQRPLTLGADHIVTLALGDHALHVSAPGYVSQERPLKVVGGEEYVLAIDLKPWPSLPQEEQRAALAPGQPLASSESKRDAAASSSVWSSPLLWTAVGVVLVGTATALAFAVANGGEQSVDYYGGSSGKVLQAR